MLDTFFLLTSPIRNNYFTCSESLLDVAKSNLSLVSTVFINYVVKPRLILATVELRNNSSELADACLTLSNKHLWSFE